MKKESRRFLPFGGTNNYILPTHEMRGNSLHIFLYISTLSTTAQSFSLAAVAYSPLTGKRYCTKKQTCATTAVCAQ